MSPAYIWLLEQKEQMLTREKLDEFTVLQKEKPSDGPIPATLWQVLFQFAFKFFTLQSNSSKDKLVLHWKFVSQLLQK